MANTTEHDIEFKKKMRELRCLTCRALMLKEYIFKGRLEIICHKCGEVNRFLFRDHQNARIKTEHKLKLYKIKRKG